MAFSFGPIGYGGGGHGGGEYRSDSFCQPSSGNGGLVVILRVVCKQSTPHKNVKMERDSKTYFLADLDVPAWEAGYNDWSFGMFKMNNVTLNRHPIRAYTNLSRDTSTSVGRTYTTHPWKIYNDNRSGFAEFQKIDDVVNDSDVALISSRIKKKDTTTPLKLIGIKKGLFNLLGNKSIEYLYNVGVTYTTGGSHSMTVYGKGAGDQSEYTTHMYILLQGGGGGGGGADNKWYIGNWAAGGGGGGGGGAMLIEFCPSSGSTYTFNWTVGEGGAAGKTAEWSSSGSSGGDTTLEIYRKGEDVAIYSAIAEGGRAGDNGQHKSPGDSASGGSYETAGTPTEAKVLVAVKGGSGGRAAAHDGSYLADNGGNPTVVVNNLGSDYKLTFDLGQLYISADIFGKGGERGYYDDSGGGGGGSWCGKGGYYSEAGSDNAYW